MKTKIFGLNSSVLLTVLPAGLFVVISLACNMKSRPWPDDLHKSEIFQRCAEALRSAVDTNQIEFVYLKMTNQPAIRQFINPPNQDGSITITFATNEVTISRLRTFMSQVASDLDNFGGLLTDPKFNSYIGTGYRAQISDSANFFYFDFWSKGNPPVVMVKSLEKRTLDAMHVFLSARFYENGKLQEFRINSPNPESITFSADGSFNSYHFIENNMAMDLKFDNTGNMIVRSFLISGK